MLFIWAFSVEWMRPRGRERHAWWSEDGVSGRRWL